MAGLCNCVTHGVWSINSPATCHTDPSAPLAGRLATNFLYALSMNISWQVYVFNGLCTTFVRLVGSLIPFFLAILAQNVCIAKLEGLDALCPLAKFGDASIYNRSSVHFDY